MNASTAQKQTPKTFKPSSFAQKMATLGEETLKKTANASGDAAGQILEQMGWGTLPGSSPPVNYGAQAEAETKKRELEQKEAEVKAKDTQQIISLKKQLEEEIERYRRIREEQLRKRREQPAEELSQAEGKPGLPEPKARPKKGLFAGLRARKRESQSEMAGMRRSG